MIRPVFLCVSFPLIACSAVLAQDETSLNRGAYGSVMTPEQVMRELGPGTGLLPGDQAYEGRPVKSVSVRYRSTGKTVSEDRLKNLLATQPGTSYSPEVVNKDLERLLESGLVGGNTTVAVEPSGDGVAVVFEMAAQNLLGGVGFRGNTAFDNRDLSEECGLKGGEALSDKALSSAIAKLRTYYQEARYPDVRVSYFYQKTERPGFVDVVFDINEGKKANIIKIDFVGNEHISAKDLRQVMKTKEKGWLTWITKSGRIDREQVEDDLAELVTYYRNKGYLRVKLDKVEYFDAGKGNEQKLTMRITLTEGRRYKVNQVAFGPTKVFTAQELIPGLSMYNGDTYSAQKVADDVTMIRRYYGSRGYADASVRPDIQEVGVDPKTGYGQINIVYHVTEGNPYRVGNIRLTGNNRTKDYVIRQELPLQSNDPMNAVDLDTAQKRLQNLNYFDMVDVAQVGSTRPGYRDINIEVAEKRTGSLNIGVAFSSIESVYLFAGITQSNFDMYDWSSFVGGGQRFAINARVGFETQDLDIIPSTMDLAGVEIELARSGNHLTRLRETLAPLRESDTYDYCIMDTPPSLGVLMTSALAACDEVLTPLQCEWFGLEGLAKILHVTAQICASGANPRIRHEGVLMTMYDGRTNLSRQVIDQVERHLPQMLYKTVIPRSIRLGEAPSFGHTIFEHDPSGAAADAYLKAAREFIKRHKP